MQVAPSLIPPGRGNVAAAPQLRTTALRKGELTDRLTEHMVILCLCKKKKNNQLILGSLAPTQAQVAIFKGFTNLLSVNPRDEICVI